MASVVPRKRSRKAAAGADAETSERGPGAGAGSGGVTEIGGMITPYVDEEMEEEEQPDVVVHVFHSARVLDIVESNRAAGFNLTPSADNPFLHDNMNFSMVLRGASVWPNVFGMVTAFLNRGSAKQGNGSIAFTMVKLNGKPHLAIDLWDASKTTVVSARMATDVHIHPSYVGEDGCFPVFKVKCKSMVDKLSHAKDFNRVMIFQQRTNTDRLDILIDTPDKPNSNIYHDTVKIEADRWESISLEDINHSFTLQLAVKNLSNLCKRQADGDGRITFRIYEDPERTTRVTGPGRERHDYILVVQVTNSIGELSTMIRPISIETELSSRIDPATGQPTRTLHLIDADQYNALTLVDNIGRYTLKYDQTFSSGYIEAFLSKFEGNKMVTLRLGNNEPMVMSFVHGNIVLCQLVLAPIITDEE